MCYTETFERFRHFGTIVLQCKYQYCIDLKYHPEALGLRARLLDYLRREHTKWWRRYERLYDSGKYRRFVGRGMDDWEYTEEAVEMITRCRLYDGLYAVLSEMDFFSAREPAQVCADLFKAVQRQRPAFPDAAISVNSSLQVERELRREILKTINL